MDYLSQSNPSTLFFTDTCVPKTPSAGVCHVMRADIAIAGQIDWAAIELRDSLEYIFENDATFTDDLPLLGVLQVRLKGEFEEAAANSVPKDQVLESANSGRSAVVAILSAAGVTIIVAIAFRSIKRGQAAADKHEETEDEEASQGDTIPVTLSHSTVV